MVERRRGAKRSIYLGPELDAAINLFLAKSGTEFNALVRTALANAIGKPELAESVKMGRPAVAPVPVKKTPKSARATPAKRTRKPAK